MRSYVNAITFACGSDINLKTEVITETFPCKSDPKFAPQIYETWENLE